MTPLVCIQCALKALVEGQPPPRFNETPDAHLARVHPNARLSIEERQELIVRLRRQLEKAEGLPSKSSHMP